MEVGGKYSLSIPAFLTKANNLNEDASLEYQHAWKEFYVIVIDEAKQEIHDVLEEYELTDEYENNIEGYSELVLDGIIESLEDPSHTDLLDVTINKMPAKLTTVKGTVEGMEIFYAIGIYEGVDTYYQVITWTLHSRRDRYKTRMNQILYTLSELKG